MKSINQKTIYTIGIVIVIIILLFTLKKCNSTVLEKYKADQLEVLKKEYYKLCSDNLRIIFKSFFDLSNGSGRVSVYKYENDAFKLLGVEFHNVIDLS